MGTPAFAVPSLERLVSGGHEVLAVYTQPDRPKGRGGKMTASPVKESALRLGLEAHQPERVRRPEVVEELAKLNADAMVVVGYGQIIPQAIIDLPKHGIINVHASLLPKYRGAAPIQWAIANGESVTGVTTMRIDAGLDTGDMLLKEQTAIGAEENAIELSERLSRCGAELLLPTLAGIEAGTIQPEPQNNAEATLAPILNKEDGDIDWTQPARTIFNRCRGLLPWPGTWTTLRGQLFHVWKSRVADQPVAAAPGTLVAAGRRMLIACGEETALELLEVQLEGRKRVTAEAFLNGWKPAPGEKVGHA